MKLVLRAVLISVAVIGHTALVAGQGPDDAMPRLSPPAVIAPINPTQAPTVRPTPAATIPLNGSLVPLPPGCEANAAAIGLSRIVEIDTTGGPRLGHSQYKDVDFLQDGEVVLTFDDGPMRRYTKPILDTLDAHCTRATFFSVGKMALSDPQTLQETARRGHTVASHTWSHTKLSKVSAAQAVYEIELGNSAVTHALGGPISSFFRYPYLRDSAAAGAYLKSRNLSAVSIEVDSQDFRTHNPGQVLRNVMSQLKVAKKGIILFHDIQPATAGALPSLLENLKASGFKIVQLISKNPGTTLPEYDARVVKEVERRQVASVTPGGHEAHAADAAGKPANPPATLPSKADPRDVAVKSESQPQAPQPAQATGPASEAQAPTPVPPPSKPPRQPLWFRDDDPWRIKTFTD